jgi:hypothetical protein
MTRKLMIGVVILLATALVSAGGRISQAVIGPFVPR